MNLQINNDYFWKLNGKVMANVQSERIESEHFFWEKSNTFFKISLLEGSDENLLAIEGQPGILEIAGLCVCLGGEAELTIESRSYSLKQGDMCIVFPNDILLIREISADFKGYTLTCIPDFYYGFSMPLGTSIYMYIKDNPCISLTRREQDDLIRMCDNLKEQDLRKDHPYWKEISELLATGVFYEIAGIYKRGTPLAQQPYTRKYKLLYEFVNLVVKNFREQRGIEYYADTLCISSRHLSSICKEITGQTAKEYLNNYIITNIRLMLTTSDLTITQISDEFNFPNASFFTKFFKQKTGMTPKQYRNTET